MKIEDYQTVLYGIFKSGKFKEKCRYSWRQFGNPAWVSASVAKVYNLGDITKSETMARLTLAIKSEYIFTYEKLALALMCDGTIVFKEDMESVAGALRSFEDKYKGAGFLLQLASGIDELRKNKKCQALALDISHTVPQWEDYKLPENPDNTYVNIREVLGWTSDKLPLFAH